MNFKKLTAKNAPLVIAPLFSGSKGNAIWISGGGVSVLIDAGKPRYQIERELKAIDEDPADLSAILITHEHGDHVSGVGALSRKYDIPVYANADTWYGMANRVGEIKAANMREIDDTDFYIEKLCVQPFDVPHDAARPFSYTVEYSGRKVAVITDQGVITKKTLGFTAGSDIVLLESNHDVQMLKTGPYPAELKKRILSRYGHLSNDDAANAALLLARSGTKCILLGHISEQNNERALALNTVKDFLESNGIIAGKHITIALANYGSATGKFTAV